MGINLLGLSGYISSGKDTFAKMLQMAIFQTKAQDNWTLQELETYYSDTIRYASGWQIKKFATPLKQIACILLGCTMEQLEDQEFKKSILEEEWWQPSYRQDAPYPYKPTVREFLQRLGTEAIRGQVHDNAWVNAMFSDYHYANVQGGFMNFEEGEPLINILYKEKQSKWIITDLRFPNEYKAIKDHGGILFRINRGNPYDNTNKHSSETALDNYEFDYTICNDGTLENLYETAKDLVNLYKLS